MSGTKPCSEDDVVDAIHPGEILREDFLIGTQVSIEEVAMGTALAPAIVESLLNKIRPVDAWIDLCLGRYFGMSEGFFLRLQNSFDLEQERRSHKEELSRIVCRGAA